MNGISALIEVIHGAGAAHDVTGVGQFPQANRRPEVCAVNAFPGQLEGFQVIAVQIRHVRRLGEIQGLDVVVREIVLQPKEIKMTKARCDAAAGTSRFEFADDPALPWFVLKKFNHRVFLVLYDVIKVMNPGDVGPSQISKDECRQLAPGQLAAGPVPDAVENECERYHSGGQEAGKRPGPLETEIGYLLVEVTRKVLRFKI